MIRAARDRATGELRAFIDRLIAERERTPYRTNGPKPLTTQRG